MGGVNHGRALTVDVAYLLRARAYGRYGTLFVTKLEIAYGHHVSIVHILQKYSVLVHRSS